MGSVSDLEHAANLGPLAGAEVLARASLLGDRLQVDLTVLFPGVELQSPQGSQKMCSNTCRHGNCRDAELISHSVH